MTAQDESKMSYYFKSSFDFSKREIDLARPAEEVSRFVRAMAFPEYQLPVLRGRRVKNCRILPMSTTQDAGVALLETAVSTSFATGDGGVVELEWANDEQPLSETRR
jgi:methionyl-tRNA formyltransferase